MYTKFCIESGEFLPQNSIRWISQRRRIKCRLKMFSVIKYNTAKWRFDFSAFVAHVVNQRTEHETKTTSSEPVTNAATISTLAGSDRLRQGTTFQSTTGDVADALRSQPVCSLVGRLRKCRLGKKLSGRSEQGSRLARQGRS